jgi:tetratricopeptide (TPR) repeat protein
MLHLWPRYLCAVALLPLLGVAACGSAATPAQQATNLVNKGLEAQLASDLGTAQSDYQQAIQLDNSNKLAHYDLGTIYGLQGRTAQAIQEYRTTLSLDPNFVRALYNLAVATTASDPAGAEQLYRKVISVQPTDASAWLNLGFILISEGKADEAKADWAKATSLDPTLASRIPTSTPSGSASSPSPTPTP